MSMDFTHPSMYFMKYLITLPQPEAADDNWVRLKIQQIGYPAPTPAYVAGLRALMAPDFPVNYVPTDRYNRETVKYLRNHGIWSLHNPNNETKEAIQILVDAQARRTIEQLLLGRLDPKEVAAKVNSRFRKFYTEDTIRDYGHYFWNCSIMKTTDWVSFFDQYDRAEGQRSMSIVQSGGGMALHVAGFKQDIEAKEMLREMLEAVHFDFKDWKNAPRSPERTRAFALLTKAAATIDERMAESSTAVRDHLSVFRSWQMSHSNKKVPGIEDVAPHGNFTESGADLPELPEKATK